MRKVYKLIAVFLISVAASFCFFEANSCADDWDDAGKILAGVLGGYIGHEVLDGVFSENSYSYGRSYSRHRSYPRDSRWVYVYRHCDDDDCTGAYHRHNARYSHSRNRRHTWH